MMLGVLAAAYPGAAGGEVPEGAIAYADFLTGTYDVAGTPSTAAAMVSEPSWITANGLEIPDETEGGAVHLLGGLLAAVITANWTIVIDYQEISSGSGTDVLLLDVTNGVNFAGGVIEVSRHHLQDFRINNDSPAASSLFITDDEAWNPIGNGIYRVAATRTNTKLAISVKGSAVIAAAQSMSDMSGLTTATFGGDANASAWSWDATYIRSIAVYAPQADAALPGLSSL